MVSILLLCGVLLLTPVPGSAADKVGVLFAVHGGFSQYSPSVSMGCIDADVLLRAESCCLYSMRCGVHLPGPLF